MPDSNDSALVLRPASDVQGVVNACNQFFCAAPARAAIAAFLLGGVSGIASWSAFRPDLLRSIAWVLFGGATSVAVYWLVLGAAALVYLRRARRTRARVVVSSHGVEYFDAERTLALVPWPKMSYVSTAADTVMLVARNRGPFIAATGQLTSSQRRRLRTLIQTHYDRSY
jgi:hypothetical protein